MRTRVLSASLIIAVLFAAVWWLPPWGTLAVAALAAALAGGELAALSSAVGAPVSPVFLGAIGALTCAAFAIGDAPEFLVVAILLASIVSAGVAALAAGPPSPSVLTRAGVTFMAPIYIGLPLGVFVWIRTHAAWGREAVLLPIAIVALSDTAQYLTGRALGRRKLAPAISPAKTVEGALGGLVAAAIAGAFLAPLWLANDLHPPLGSWAVGAMLGVALAAAGMVGDLFESALKRGAGVKDSSHRIPGHGGVLDRIDSHLFAAPIYYLFLRYVA